MADTSEIVRLMRHAADRLAEEDVWEILPPGAGGDYREHAITAHAAVVYAEAVLRMVAAVVSDGEATP